LKNRAAALIVTLILILAFSSTEAPTPFAVTTAGAAVQKSLEGAGGGGDASGAGDRFGSLLSGWGVPAITALAGCLLIGALATRNIGSAVGIIAITLVSLIFLLAPQSVETFAKGIANVVF
jgi:hypothetical protein